MGCLEVQKACGTVDLFGIGSVAEGMYGIDVVSGESLSNTNRALKISLGGVEALSTYYGVKISTRKTPKWDINIKENIADEISKTVVDLTNKKVRKSMKKRGWTQKMIDRALKNPVQRSKGRHNHSTVFIDPKTKKTLVRDNVTKEIYHFSSDPSFEYGDYLIRGGGRKQ